MFPKDRGQCRFSETLPIGEEGSFYRGNDHHPVVDDVGIFLHLDHGANTAAPLSIGSERLKRLPRPLEECLARAGPALAAFARSRADGSATREVRAEPRGDGHVLRPA